jgi:hypothetical protein
LTLYPQDNAQALVGGIILISNIWLGYITTDLKLISVKLWKLLALVVANKEIGLEVNGEKTKYIVMSWNQNAGQNHNIKIDSTSIERWNNSNIWEQP